MKIGTLVLLVIGIIIANPSVKVPVYDWLTHGRLSATIPVCSSPSPAAPSPASTAQ